MAGRQPITPPQEWGGAGSGRFRTRSDAAVTAAPEASARYVERHPARRFLGAGLAPPRKRHARRVGVATCPPTAVPCAARLCRAVRGGERGLTGSVTVRRTLPAGSTDLGEAEAPKSHTGRTFRLSRALLADQEAHRARRAGERLRGGRPTAVRIYGRHARPRHGAPVVRVTSRRPHVGLQRGRLLLRGAHPPAAHPGQFGPGPDPHGRAPGGAFGGRALPRAPDVRRESRPAPGGRGDGVRVPAPAAAAVGPWEARAPCQVQLPRRYSGAGESRRSTRSSR
jgi:hypothetical protein